MDDYRQKLENRFEEAEFELLFDDYLTDLGEACQKEFEQAKARGEVTDMPPEMKKQLLSFIENYNPVEEKIPRHVSIIRYFFVAAIACTVLLISLVTVQAMGVDVFGKIGNWTNSVFHYESNANEKLIESQSVTAPLSGLQAVLKENHIANELAPTWIPDGFTISSLNVSSNDKVINLTAEYSNQTETIVIQIANYDSSETSDNIWIEKDDNNPEVYYSNDREYYVFSNLNYWIGVWQGETDSIFIQVSSCREDLISIIDSIGGIDND